MSPADSVCVALLWETSSPAARSRYLREERCGVPAHDPWVPRVERTDPRDYWAACAQCGRPIVVDVPGAVRRYCGPACRQRTWDQRNSERRSASQHARRQAERARRRAVAA